MDESPRPPPPPAPVPTAQVRRSRWFGIVWAVPLAALILVAFLGIRAFANRGIDVVVTFDSAAGAKVDDTKVIYQGVEAGSVTKIEVNPDGRRIDMTLRLDPRSEPVLTTSTKFWLIGATPTLNDLSSVKAAVSGVAIGVAPGTGGTPTRHFRGLNEPPIVMPGTVGRAFVLTSDVLGTARVGSSLYFRGQEVGKVTATRFEPAGGFQLDVFLFAPYDRLVRRDTIFWVSSPVRVSLTDTGASASLEHAGALINGAVEVDHLSEDVNVTPSPAGASFVLYQNRSDAEAGPVGPEVPYAFSFAGPGGELSPGSPVRLLGFQIGEVKTVRMVVDPRTGGVSTAVVAVLYPRRLQVAAPASASASAAGPADAEWRDPTDAAVNRLLALGHRAQLVQKPPVIGGRIITLDRVAGAGPAVLGAGEPRKVPSVEASAGFDELTGQVNQLLGKLNAIPFEAIGRDVQGVTGHLSQLVSSPQLTDSLQRLNGTLAQAEKLLGDVRPQVGPLFEKINRAADEATATVSAARGVIGGGPGDPGDASLPAALQELTDAARSIRTLADYLGRHPESLIRGRGAEADTDPRKDAR